MKSFLVIAVTGALLAACAPTGQLSPQSQAAVAKLCTKDAQLQPVAVSDLQEIQLVAAVAGLAVPKAAEVSNDVGQVVSVDQSLIHPFVLGLCAKLAPAS